MSILRHSNLLFPILKSLVAPFSNTSSELNIYNIFQEFAENFTLREVKPFADDVHSNNLFPKDQLLKLGHRGLLAPCIPEELKGAALDTICHFISLEEVSKACASCGTIMNTNTTLYLESLLQFGTKEQVNEFALPFVRGEEIGSIGFYEIGDNDSFSKITARKEGNSFILNGVKEDISCGCEAKAAIILAQTDPNLKENGCTCFITRLPNFGITHENKKVKLGLRGATVCDLFFQDVRIPMENLLGQQGEGYDIATSILNFGTLGLACQALGVSRAALESFHDLDLKTQTDPELKIKIQLKDIKKKINDTRHLIHKASSLKEAGENYSEEAFSSLQDASATTTLVTTLLLQLFGERNSTLRHFADAKEIQNLVTKGYSRPYRQNTFVG